MTTDKTRNSLKAAPDLSGDAGFRRCFARTRRALLWERLWPRLWPLLGVIAMFASLAMFGLFRELPVLWHGILLALFAGCTVLALKYLYNVDVKICAQDVFRRMERDNRLPHRPFDVIHDQLFRQQGQTPETMRLWQEHVRRAIRQMDALKPSWPHPGLAAKDVHAFRFAVILLVVAGWGVAGNDAWPRIKQALTPGISFSRSVAGDLGLWITPPAYTGMAPVFLTVKSNNPPRDAVVVAVGSKILIKGGGDQRESWLQIGSRKIPFKAVADNDSQARETTSYQISMAVTAADRAAREMVVSHDRGNITRIPVKIVADAPPTIEWKKTPRKSKPSDLRFSYDVADDYGVEKVELVIEHDKGLKRSDGSSQYRLRLPGGGKKSVTAEIRKNLTDHPWAGESVTLKLVATDEKPQTGTSPPVTMVLPERTFTHPVARELVRIRKKLNDPSVDSRIGAAEFLRGINQTPSAYNDDLGIYLTIGIIRRKLFHAQNADAGFSVQPLLWQLALKIEDGDFAVAEENLDDLRDRIVKAIEDGADRKQIDRLLNELTAALNRYLSSLADFMDRKGMENVPLSAASRTLQGQDLKRLIDQARAFSKAGDGKTARQLLQQMGRMMEQIRRTMKNGAQARTMKQAGQAIEDLRDLMARQTELLEKTFNQLKNRTPEASRSGEIGKQFLPPPGAVPDDGAPPSGSATRPNPQNPESPLRPRSGGRNDLFPEQQQIRKQLGRMMLKMDQLLGRIPDQMGRAERAMNRAGKALSENKPGMAVRPETEAVEQLRQAMENISEQISRRFGGLSTGTPAGQIPGRDPFGRPNAGGFGGIEGDGTFKLPDGKNLKRSREILQELRRRSDQPGRPAKELDYFDRLLNRF